MPERLLTGSVLDEQVALETQAVRQGVLRYRRLAQEAIERGEGANLKPAERLLLHWLKPMIAAIRQEKREVRAGKAGVGRGIFGPTLQLLDADRLAVITLHNLVSRCMSEPEGVPVSRLAYAIGRDIFAEINIDVLRRDDSEAKKQLERRFKRIDTGRVNWWAKKKLDDPVWERQVCAHLGSRLIWLTIEVASATGYDEDFRLAFQHERRWVEKKTVAFVRMSEEVFDLIDEGHEMRKHLRPKYQPMLVEPYPWQADAQGGYVRIRTPFISKPTPGQKAALKDADLGDVHECLNAVNATPWRINHFVLATMQELWRAGGGLAGMPKRDDAPLPPRPLDIDEDDEAKEAWKKDASAIHRHNALLRSERVGFTQKLDMAERLAERHAIWYPHQFDFRGRCYPIPQYLNHQGDDVCRGLMEFAESRHADASHRATYWLCVHMANCCGVDKVGYDARVHWVRDHMQTFAGWVADPLSNTGWMEADKPWQALAAAHALDDPDAAARLPIQLDGTCNGLQHYAALGRDSEGAAVVNMLPAMAPADIYSIVAEEVQKLVEVDAAAGVPEAEWTLPIIDRKTVKQPVMTSVYGVTMVGAREQVYQALDGAGLDDDRRYKASYYISRVVLKALGNLCQSATAVMDWLRQCARIAAAQGQPVQWVTPLGMPIIQPYRKVSTITIKTILQELRLRVDDESVPVAPGRQVDGFPPNFVHSLDATHMLMTARECRQRGMAFAAVHDSYWTHAADVDAMAAVLRTQFIKLHSRPLLADLHRDLQRRYPEAVFPDPPAPGEYDITTVHDAPYFFS